MGILTLSISVCGAGWLQRLCPFFQESSHKQLGPGLVPFMDIQQINAVPSTSDNVLPGVNQFTSAAHVHTPRVRCSSHQTPSTRNEPDLMRDSLDIEDEYFSVGNEFDCDRFTQDYFEYEQVQKDIIVKNRLRNHIDIWRKIGTNQFILDTIMYGYKILFNSCRLHLSQKIISLLYKIVLLYARRFQIFWIRV